MNREFHANMAAIFYHEGPPPYWLFAHTPRRGRLVPKSCKATDPSEAHRRSTTRPGGNDTQTLRHRLTNYLGAYP